MKSTEAGSLLQDWLDGAEPELSLVIDGGEVVVQRAAGTLLCKAALSVAWRGQPGLLEKALCQPGGAPGGESGFPGQPA